MIINLERWRGKKEKEEKREEELSEEITYFAFRWKLPSFVAIPPSSTLLWSTVYSTVPT